jgi:hypothetical protein
MGARGGRSIAFPAHNFGGWLTLRHDRFTPFTHVLWRRLSGPPGQSGRVRKTSHPFSPTWVRTANRGACGESVYSECIVISVLLLSLFPSRGDTYDKLHSHFVQFCVHGFKFTISLTNHKHASRLIGIK